MSSPDRKPAYKILPVILKSATCGQNGSQNDIRTIARNVPLATESIRMRRQKFPARSRRNGSFGFGTWRERKRSCSAIMAPPTRRLSRIASAFVAGLSLSAGRLSSNVSGVRPRAAQRKKPALADSGASDWGGEMTMFKNETLSRSAVAAAAFVVASVLPFGAQAQQPIVMKISLAALNDPLHQFAKDYAALLEKDSGGRIKTEIYPASQLG